MTIGQKKILAVCLVVAAGFVWMPILTAKPAPVRLPEIPALGPGDVPAPSRTSPSQTAPTVESAPVRTGAKSADTHADQDDLAAALEASIARARLILPESSGADLTQLASAWSASTTIPAPAPVATQTSPALDRPPPSVAAAPVTVELAPKADPIDAFLAAHPLRGTLIGATQRLACLGPLLVGVGDEPVAGLVVSAIEPRFVTFTRAGRPVRADLIPFEARAPAVQAQTSSSAANASGAGAGAPSPAPSPAAKELDKSLPLPKQAADAANGSGSTDAAKEKPPAPAKGSKDSHGS